MPDLTVWMLEERLEVWSVRPTDSGVSKPPGKSESGRRDKAPEAPDKIERSGYIIQAQ